MTALDEQALQNPFTSGDWRRTFYFSALLAGGLPLTVLLVALLWPSRTQRNPTLISLVFSWWISIFPCLPFLFYAGRISGPEPSQALCLTSAVLSAAQALMVALTIPCLILHVWLIVHNTLRTQSIGPVCNPHVLRLLLVIPYIGFIVSGLTVLSLGLAHPERIRRELLHCIVEDDYYGLIAGILCAVPLLCSVAVSVRIFILFRRNRMDLIRTGIDVSTMTRGGVALVYVLFGAAFYATNAAGWDGAAKDLFRSTGPLAVFVIFGTQKSIWRVWLRAPVHGTPNIHEEPEAVAGEANGISIGGSSDLRPPGTTSLDSIHVYSPDVYLPSNTASSTAFSCVQFPSSASGTSTSRKAHTTSLPTTTSLLARDETVPYGRAQPPRSRSTPPLAFSTSSTVAGLTGRRPSSVKLVDAEVSLPMVLLGLPTATSSFDSLTSCAEPRASPTNASILSLATSSQLPTFSTSSHHYDQSPV